MKMKKGYMLLMLIGLFYSCGEESLPEPSSGTPVFTASGTFGNNPIDIKAGEEDFYMFTEFSKDETNVFTFSGTFEKLEPDCNAICNEKLRISIRDFQMTEGDFVLDIDSSLFASKYEYDDGREDSTFVNTITSYEVSFTNNTIINVGEDLFTWNFFPSEADSYSIETFGPTSVPEIQSFPTLDFPVTLERLGFDEIITCKDYTRTLDAMNMSCSSGLKVTQIDTLAESILVGVQDTLDLLNASWLIDNTPIFSIDSEISIFESGEFCVQAMYSNGCFDSTCIRTNTNPDQLNYCSVAFDYSVEPQFEQTLIPPDNPFGFSEIVVEYVTEDGLSFRSDVGPQLDESQFTILEVSNFEDNENGEKTKQLKIQFNCVLYAENDVSMNLENAEVVMAVAYPNR